MFGIRKSFLSLDPCHFNLATTLKVMRISSSIFWHIDLICAISGGAALDGDRGPASSTPLGLLGEDVGA